MWVILKVMESLIVHSVTIATILITHVYDSLYLVDTMKIERGRYGKLVFIFVLNRILGQLQTCFSLKDHGENSRFTSRKKRNKPKGCVVEKEVVRVKDL